MSYDYSARAVFVTELTAERHPTRYDLCVRHLRSLSAPKGWTVHQDESRHPAEAAVDGAPRERTGKESGAALSAGVARRAGGRPPGSVGSSSNHPADYLRAASAQAPFLLH